MNREKLVIALLRASIGVMFLRAAWPKVASIGGWPERMLGFINFQQNTPEWYQTLLDGVVVPNPNLFGYLVAYGELGVGIALVLGLLTRPALIGGLFMVANFLLTKGTAFWSPSNNDSYLILVLLALLFLKPGHYLGVDAWLARRFPGYKA